MYTHMYDSNQEHPHMLSKARYEHLPNNMWQSIFGNNNIINSA